MNKTIYRIISVITVLTLMLSGHTSAKASNISNSQALQTTKIYYVSPAGNDANPGTATAPFKTLTKGVSTVVAGDTLMVLGTYNQPLVISKSGTASAPINIIGSAAVLDMGGSQANGIKVSGSYINISGFEVKGTTSHGVLIGSKNVKFENSSVHHSVLENGSGTCSGSGGWGSAVKVMVGGENVVIRGNSVYENCGEGIGITRGVNVLVENNTVRDNYSVNIYLDNSPYTTAQNNNVSCTGIYLRDGRRPSGIAIAEEEYAGWGAQRHDNYVLNNYVTGCYDGISSWQPEVVDGKLINAVISGNTVASGTRRSIYLDSVNQNVLIANNAVFAAVVVKNPSGVTIQNNTTSGSVTATATQSVPATAILVTPSPTLSAATATGDPITLPTNTPVSTDVILPTGTSLPVMPTNTLVVPASPTTTNLPTILPTNTALPTNTVAPLPTITTQPSLPTATVSTSSTSIKQPGIYDDKSGYFTYSKGWKDVSAKDAYNGSYKTNSKYGSFITFSITGQSFSLLYTDGSTYRQMSIYVDGVLVDVVKRSTSTTKYQKRWDSGALSNGVHQIQLVFVNARGTFDAVVIPGAAASSTAVPASPTPVVTLTAQPTLSVPTNTPVPATVVPTNTPVPPTIAPSNTPVPETSTPEPVSTP